MTITSPSATATPAREPVTSSSAAFVFYDVETLHNVFTMVAYHRRSDRLHIFHLMNEDEGNEAATALARSRTDPAIRQAVEEGLAWKALDSNPALALRLSADGYRGWHDALHGAPELGLEPRIQIHDLASEEGCLFLASILGLSDAKSVNDPSAVSSYREPWPAGESLVEIDPLRPVCDTDPDFDPFEKHPYLMGYNSTNYDTSILAVLLAEAFSYRAARREEALAGEPRAEIERRHRFTPVKTRVLREANDRMFSPEYIRKMPTYLRSEERGGWDSPANLIRRAMLATGRLLDVGRFNESQQKVAQKRLSGNLGHQILESDKLSGPGARVETLADLFELIAYNVSDCVGLAQLFEHPMYSGTFDVKAGLLADYPETIYEKKGEDPVPDISPASVRSYRLAPDATSAQIGASILAPYEPLSDLETVSFDYPSKEMAKKLGIPSRNVLEETREFFESRVTTDPEHHAHKAFMAVYRFYKDIEGRNFNDSERHSDQYGYSEIASLKEMTAQMPPNNVPYYRKDPVTGEITESSCFVTFSTGGIHGAEANIELFEHDVELWRARHRAISAVIERFPDPLDLWMTKETVKNETGKKGILVTDEDGAKIFLQTTHLLTTGTTLKDLKVRTAVLALLDQLQESITAGDAPMGLLLMEKMALEVDSLSAKTAKLLEPLQTSPLLQQARERTLSADDLQIPGLMRQLRADMTTLFAGVGYRPLPERPTLFKISKDRGGSTLDPKYRFVSQGVVIHEDFTSYYPNMLRNLSAFDNPQLGVDRYAIMLEQKSAFKKLKVQAKNEGRLKDADIYAIKESGTKLVLNAASGAGDMQYDNSIRMNNRIISMRIIGQLFTYRVGQAHALDGDRVVSTNTDGIYVISSDHDRTRATLEAESASINVAIEPETLGLISKDANNRLELEVDEHEEPPRVEPDAEIIAAGGGALACHRGPAPRSLDHPAALDWAMARYLRAAVSGAMRKDRTSTEDPILPLTLADPLDEVFIRQLFAELLQECTAHTIMMFQNIVSASPSSYTYPFLSDWVDPATGATPDGRLASDEATIPDLLNPKSLHRYSRVLYTRQGTEGARSLRVAQAKTVSKTVKASRTKVGASLTVLPSELALRIFNENGLGLARQRRSDLEALPTDRDIIVGKANSISPTWPVIVMNRDLHSLTAEQIQQVLSVIDLDIYVELMISKFESSWRLKLPDVQAPDGENENEAQEADGDQDEAA